MDRKNAPMRARLNRLDVVPAGTRPGLTLKPGDDEAPPGEGPGEPRKDEYSGFVIVRLGPGLPLVPSDSKTLLDAAKGLRLAGLTRVIEEYDLSDSRRLVRSVEPEKLLGLEREAAKTELPPVHSLTGYWRIDMRQQPERVEEVVKRLNALHEVDLAYREYAVSEPVVNAADDPYNAGQDYLDAAPTGIDARWAWLQPNGEGAGVGFVDLEQGWFPNHEDFASKSPAIIYGDNMDGVGTYKGNHGTAVLGEVIADDNTVGVVGIAPSVSSVRMTSHYDAGTGTNLNVADAILGALPSMDPGDVLLLEVQRSYRPTETDDADFDAIRLAVAHGIIVVEAAGNGNYDLDPYTDASGDHIFDRSSADFRESGAIMVGSAVSTVPHNRYVSCGLGCGSNYGSRIDCYGWGENIFTCGYGDLDPGTGDDSTYTDTFSGTSGASPMVTGAALVLQGMYEANSGTPGTRLSPLQMRALLSDPATGTPQGGGVAGNIGVMPDLRAIIEDTLGVVPDVYLRDNTGDTGTIPSTGSISASPDIIVRPDAVADPQAAFGEGSGTENDSSLGYEAEAGQENSVYVRMKNRGGADAHDVTATVYWSEVATLVTPGSWNLVGTTPPVDVPQGDTLVVADRIPWAGVPATGHYCFVGILDHPGDPAPPLPGPADWDGFRNFIRNHNNVTWRNFNVVNEDPDTAPDPAQMPFIIAGAPDRARVFDLEIFQRLARGARVWLEVPLWLVKQLCEGRRWKCEIDRKRRTAKVLLPATPRIRLPEMLLKKGARIRARFEVTGVRKHVRRGNWFAIRQLYEQEELGRITWQFQPRKPDSKRPKAK